MFATGLLNIARVASATRQVHHYLPDLPYGYEAFEPIITREIMYLHYAKHHATYVNNLNCAINMLDCAVQNCKTSDSIILSKAIKYNGGGHLNHSIFWKSLTPHKTTICPLLCCAITKDFCDAEIMKSKLLNTALCLQGSGWAWLGYNKDTKQLEITACADEDPLEPTTGLVPLLGIDVWEHSYYLQYKNVRNTYLRGIFELINWAEVSRRYEAAACCS